MLNPERRSPARLEARCHATIASTDSVRLLGVAGQLRKKGVVRCKKTVGTAQPSAVDLASVVPDSVELVQREV